MKIRTYVKKNSKNPNINIFQLNLTPVNDNFSELRFDIQEMVQQVIVYKTQNMANKS